MRKVILSMMVSLDGYIEDDHKKIDWHVWDEEMSQYMIHFFTRIDLLLFGRITYQKMAEFWPTPASATEDPTIADRMNTLPKVVFSTTLKNADWGKWNNSMLVKENIVEEISRLKQQPGKDMVIFGGADLASTFVRLDLIDEYQMIINPVVLGNGTPLFQGLQEKLDLKLLKTQAFNCGNVVLYYEQKRKKE